MIKLSYNTIQSSKWNLSQTPNKNRNLQVLFLLDPDNGNALFAWFHFQLGSEPVCPEHGPGLHRRGIFPYAERHWYSAALGAEIRNSSKHSRR